MAETTPEDWAFLQQLYAQDTLYVIPEEGNTEPVPTQAAVIPRIPQFHAQETPVPVQAEAVKEEPVKAPAPPIKSEVQMDTSVLAQHEPVQEEIKWLGEALKGTYLLFSVDDSEFVTMPQHLFLQKVMAAVGLTTMQVRFGNLSPAITQNIKELAARQQAKHILLFGESLPVENLLKLEPYRMYKAGETRFVRVDTLANIEQSNDLKKKLWDVLQKIFLQ